MNCSQCGAKVPKYFKHTEDKPDKPYCAKCALKLLEQHITVHERSPCKCCLPLHDNRFFQLLGFDIDKALSLEKQEIVENFRINICNEESVIGYHKRNIATTDEPMYLYSVSIYGTEEDRDLIRGFLFGKCWA